MLRREMTKAPTDRKQVLAWLATQTDKQLVELFSELQRTREWGRKDLNGRLRLAEVTEGEPAEWQLSLAAVHDPAVYEGGWDDQAGLYQSGGCCGLRLVSWAKHARCPLCGEKAYLT